jgi:hypothetical protein
MEACLGSSRKIHCECDGSYWSLDLTRPSHWSLFSLRLPQCVSLRSGLNTRSTWRFMTPMLASMGSPPRLHSISTSMAVRHSDRSDFFL